MDWFRYLGLRVFAGFIMNSGTGWFGFRRCGVLGVLYIRWVCVFGVFVWCGMLWALIAWLVIVGVCWGSCVWLVSVQILVVSGCGFLSALLGFV